MRVVTTSVIDTTGQYQTIHTTVGIISANGILPCQDNLYINASVRNVLNIPSYINSNQLYTAALLISPLVHANNVTLYHNQQLIIH